MNEELRRYLDGELPRAELSPDAWSEAEVWDSVLAEARALHGVVAPPWLEARVMATIPPGPPRPAWRRAWSWLLEPRPVRVRPVVALTVAAAMLVLIARPLGRRTVEAPALPAVEAAARVGAEPAAVVYVQFTYAGEPAGSVAVAGDFNGWNPEGHALRDPDGDGVWTGLFALRPGLHKYMFLLDGERWVTDPRAERYVDDGFGMRNALLSVAAPDGRTS